MDIFDAEILSLWDHLAKEGVRYIMLGGFATNFHGYSRATDDIDLWIEDTLENRKRLRRAIDKHGSGDYEPLERMQFVPGWTDLRLNSGFKLDLMTNVKGLENLSFDECYNMAIVAEIERVPVRFLHYNHLIASKKAANRLKDQLDVQELEKIHKFIK
ncbi:MAG TPA: hypothetical protein VIM64_02060 [Puia sp.]